MLKLLDPRCAALIAAGALCALVGVAHGNTAASAAVSTAAAKVRHVFVIVLENKSFDNTFATSTQDPYLRTTLVPMGGLLTQYYGTGHFSLDNYISMISGQAPTPDTSVPPRAPTASPSRPSLAVPSHSHRPPPTLSCQPESKVCNKASHPPPPARSLLRPPHFRAPRRRPVPSVPPPPPEREPPPIPPPDTRPLESSTALPKASVALGPPNWSGRCS